MTYFNRILCSVALTSAMLGFISTMVLAQPKPCYEPLVYSMPRDTSVPPVDSSQPTQVKEGYLWLDDAMRLYPEYKIDSFMNTLSWGDTMKTFASVFYQAQDDNPLSMYMWSGKAMHPNPYKGDPGHAMAYFQRRIMQIVGDSGRTGGLLTADIIADVIVGDTFCVTVPIAKVPNPFNMAFVSSTILDEIKGKKVPLCVGYNMRARRKRGANSLSTGTIPWATYAVPADTGTCLDFSYSPQWIRYAHTDDGPWLMDSAGGWWVKPGHEYIVLLNFEGIGADSVNGYFTVCPGPAAPYTGTMGCMYPVVNGIVQDPNDDFGLGASAGLPVDVWKARLRARINNIINP